MKGSADYGEENLDKLGTYVPAYDAWYSERSDAEWQEYVFEYGWAPSATAFR